MVQLVIKESDGKSITWLNDQEDVLPFTWTFYQNTVFTRRQAAGTAGQACICDSITPGSQNDTNPLIAGT